MTRLLSAVLAALLTCCFAACSAEENVGSPRENSGSKPGTASEEPQSGALPSGGTAESENGAPPAEGTAEPEGAAGEGSRILVAYYSWADNAVLADDVDAVASPSVLPPGNVQQLAEWVQEETGGDLFSIRVAQPYPSDWDECLARANQERGTMPARNFWRAQPTWTNMTQCFWDIPTGGTACPWLC